MREETTNAIIQSVSLEFEDHGFLTAWLELRMNGCGVSFGGHALGRSRIDSEANGRALPKPTAHAEVWICGVLDALKVDRWEDLPGKVIRVRIEDRRAAAVGHPIEDRWFDARKAMEGVE